MLLRDRLDAFLADRGLEAVWFARPNSFAWITGGGDNVVDRDGDVGVAAAGYDGDGVTVVTDDIEAGRLRDEELPPGTTVESYTWHASSLADAVAAESPEPAAADFVVEGFATVDASSLRQPLTDDQRARYARLGTETAEAVEGVARDLSPSDTELDVAAALREALEGQDVAVPVALVGGSERAQTYRHYTPTDATLDRYALLSVTAQRNGMCVSCTRTVAFDAPEWLADRTRDAMCVEVSALAATRAVGEDGGTAGDVFAAVKDAYASLGWEGEWENHHQGGAAGFAGREWIATPDNDAPVTLPMAYAWNPTVQGAKSEDTHVVTRDGVETLSATGDWPTETASGVDDELTLERHAPLQL